MRWGDSARDHDVALAAWPSYRPLLDRWLLEELVEAAPGEVRWRDRRIPTEDGFVRMDVHGTAAEAEVRAHDLNDELGQALRERQMPLEAKASLILKVEKHLQAKQRLAREEELILAEAQRRHPPDLPPAEEPVTLPEATEPFRAEVETQLAGMPYLKMLLVGAPGRRCVIYQGANGAWSKPYPASERTATKALRARIANGFGLSHELHWGQAKAEIRRILLPRANQLLQLASVQRLLAEALANGRRVLVSNGVVFWYEQDGQVGWQVKQTAMAASGDGETLWKEGTSLSTNHGRLVILPYIKEDGEKVRGHTRNAPHDGPALPRHPDHYVEIPFEQLEDDLMVGLFGELPYE